MSDTENERGKVVSAEAWEDSVEDCQWRVNLERACCARKGAGMTMADLYWITLSHIVFVGYGSCL